MAQHGEEYDNSGPPYYYRRDKQQEPQGYPQAGAHPFDPNRQYAYPGAYMHQNLPQQPPHPGTRYMGAPPPMPPQMSAWDVQRAKAAVQGSVPARAPSPPSQIERLRVASAGGVPLLRAGYPQAAQPGTYPYFDAATGGLGAQTAYPPPTTPTPGMVAPGGTSGAAVMGTAPGTAPVPATTATVTAYSHPAPPPPPPPPPQAPASSVRPGVDPYGLLGLLQVIQSDHDLNFLALGCDLTALGLNLASAEPLYTTFASPLAEQMQPLPPGVEPEFSLPFCYYNQPPQLKPPMFSKVRGGGEIRAFKDDTLFYIFYRMPRDGMQVYAATELSVTRVASQRGWLFHRELQDWLKPLDDGTPPIRTPAEETRSYELFDHNSWTHVRKTGFTVKARG
ncbi:putative transcription factor [Paratrimastix pyriformis]|uniref:Transcription factor n=1 Tax=Paratrimastix pyriformis TaxID=342808 RepID=A0ABQ8UM68_9EUKA|nr:putative transcription factor [Paratrimastix pyriformis]